MTYRRRPNERHQLVGRGLAIRKTRCAPLSSAAKTAQGYAGCTYGESCIAARAAGHWLHVGSWEAGPRVAAIASVIESSKRLGLNPRDYLADVPPRLATGTTSEVPSLTPAAWLRAR